MPATGMRVAQADPHAIYNSAAIRRRSFGALTASRYQLACKEAGSGICRRLPTFADRRNICDRCDEAISLFSYAIILFLG
jgi:hypothetical protein